MIASNNTDQDFAAYVHWPFCQSKCPYCDFNAHLVPEALDQDRWIKAYETEIENLALRVASRPLTSIFFGGGTPSLMAAKTVDAILSRLQKTFGFADQIEISLEANPGSSDASKFKDFAKAGINRFSLGVQALDEADLKILGRQHSAAQALKAVEAAQAAVDLVSIDLIYARPRQSLGRWQKELQDAVNLGVGHLSCYQLTIEQGTRFEAMVRRGELFPLSDDLQTDFYEVTNTILSDHGFEHYEVSNYAKQGQACRHNLLYWRYGAYVGIGPGAHGRVRGHNDASQVIATRNQRMPQAWLEAIEAKGKAVQDWTPLSGSDAFVEALMMGLRIKEGLDWQSLARLDPELCEALKQLDTPQTKQMIRNNWIKRDEQGLSLSVQGRQRLNAIAAHMLDAIHA